MTEVLTLSLTFPSVVYTVLLGVVLVYWAFVLVGVVHLGEGSDGAMEGAAGAAKGALEGAAGAAKGALEGAAKGALEGAAKGVLEGASKGVLEGATHALAGHDGAAHAFGHDGLGDAMGHHGAPDGHAGHGDTDLDAAGKGGHPGVLAALLSALHLKQVPATVALSVLLTFCWLVSVVAMQILSRGGLGGSTLLRLAVLAGSPFLALPLSSLVCRPLATALTQRNPPTKTGLVGKTCRIRTGTVTEHFGEATLEDGGAGLVVRVRIEGDATIKRGELALIVDWDAEKDSFLIEPMASLLEDPKGDAQG